MENPAAHKWCDVVWCQVNAHPAALPSTSSICPRVATRGLWLQIQTKVACLSAIGLQPWRFSFSVSTNLTRSFVTAWRRTLRELRRSLLNSPLHLQACPPTYLRYCLRLDNCLLCEIYLQDYCWVYVDLKMIFVRISYWNGFWPNVLTSINDIQIRSRTWNGEMPTQPLSFHDWRGVTDQVLYSHREDSDWVQNWPIP